MDQQYPEPGRKGLTGQEGPEADMADMTSPAPDGKGVGAKDSEDLLVSFDHVSQLMQR